MRRKEIIMNNIKKVLIILAAVSAMLVTGCSKSGSSSQEDDTSSVAEYSSVSDLSSDAQDSSADESSQPKVVEQGEGIKKAAAFFENTNYEYVCKVTGDGMQGTITIVKEGSKFLQTTQYSGGTAYVYCDGKDTYSFDTFTKTYMKQEGKVTTEPSGNLITETVRKKLSPTKTHISDADTQKYAVEEYTYTGPTYITVMDFCFDKASGELRNYTATYSVEGRDNEVQQREVLKMSAGGAKVIGVAAQQIKTEYTDLASLNEMQREGLCKKLISEHDISEEEYFASGINAYDFKKITYPELAELVITNAKVKPADDDSSKAEDSSKTEESSKAQDSSRAEESSKAEDSSKAQDSSKA